MDCGGVIIKVEIVVFVRSGKNACLAFDLSSRAACLTACLLPLCLSAVPQDGGTAGGMGVPQEMVEFGRKLEREGQTEAGAKLVRGAPIAQPNSSR